MQCMIVSKTIKIFFRQKLAEAVLQNRDRNLWKEVHIILGKRSCYSSSVDAC
jgi:hypothetical protein